MDELTPNEKAATFIGWKPFRDVETCRCAEKTDYHAIVQVPVKCPNMSHPSNYMRALDGHMCELVRDYDGWTCQVAKMPLVDGQHRWFGTAGEAVIDALAELYDADHATPPKAASTNSVAPASN